MISDQAYPQFGVFSNYNPGDIGEDTDSKKNDTELSKDQPKNEIESSNYINQYRSEYEKGNMYQYAPPVSSSHFKGNGDSMMNSLVQTPD